MARPRIEPRSPGPLPNTLTARPMGHNAIKSNQKNICAKGEGAVDHSTVTKWLKNFPLVARTLIIRQGQGQVGLKLYILKL